MIVDRLPAVIRALGWGLVILLVLALLALLGLRYWALPAISANPGWVLDPVQRSLGVPVRVRQWEWSWKNLHPQVRAVGIEIPAATGEGAALAVEHVQGVLSWRSLLRLEPRFTQLKIEAPSLLVRRLEAGQWEVGGYRLSGSDASDGSALRWLSRQGRLQLSGGRLALLDAQEETLARHFTDISLQIRNLGNHHRFQVSARVSDTPGTALDLRGNFRSARFGRAERMWEEGTGTFYLDAQRVALSLLQPWLPLPAQAGRIDGTASLRTWLDWRQGQWVSGRLETQGEALTWTGEAGVVKTLTGLHARVAYAHDEAAQLMIEHLSVVPDQGAAFAPASGSVAWTEADAGQPLSLALTLRGFLLESLQPMLDVLPLSEAWKTTLADMSPRGGIEQATFHAEKVGEDWRGDAVTLRFRDVTLNPEKHDPRASGRNPGRPGGSSLKGTVHWTPLLTTVEVDAPGATLSFPSLFEDPLVKLDQFRGRALIETPPDGPLRVRFDQVVVENDDVAATAEGLWRQEGQSPSGSLTLDGVASRAKAERVHRYLPLVVDDDARRWVREAVRAGRAADVRFRVDGDLDRFPFPATQQETFRIDARIEGGRLQLVPSYLADGRVWPGVRNLSGTLVFERDGMQAEVRQGQLGLDKTVWLPAQSVRVRIEDLERKPVLRVQGAVAAEAEQVLKLVRETALNTLTDGQLAHSRGQGKVSIPLALTIPLDDVESTQVSGRVVLNQNRFQYLPALPMVEQIDGEIAFDENGIASDGVSGRFHGQPVRMRAHREGTGSRVEIDGRVDQAGLAAWLPSPIWEQVSGATSYRVEIDADRHQAAKVQVASSLEGMAFDLPAPLRKTADTALPLTVDWTLAAASEAAERWTVKVGDLAHGIWERHAGSPARDRAALNLGTPAVLSDPGLHIRADAATLDLDPWLELVGRLGEGTAGGSPTEEAAAVLPPIASIHLQTPLLTVDGQSWHGLDLHAVHHPDHEEQTWSVAVSADEAQGVLSWRAAQPFGKPARLFARLDRLRITEEMSKRDVEKAEQGDTDGLVPEIDIVVERFYLRDRHLGHLELQARHDAMQRSWQLETLRLTNPEGELEGSGIWRSSVQSGSLLPEMYLNAEYRLKDIGGTLARLGFADAMEGGRGTLSARLRWHGLPYSLDLPSLSGDLDLQLEQGRFLKVEPGAAKLLNILSLQALPRRITLDFSDVFSQGFAYDSIRGLAQIEGGVASTDSFKMIGPSATVMMAGETDLHHETQALRVVVMPQLDAGAASLLYGAVINPAVGLGVFLAQWLMQNQLTSVLTYQYDVSGNWQEPVIVKVPRAAAPNSEETSP